MSRRISVILAILSLLALPALASSFRFCGELKDVRPLGPRGVRWHGCVLTVSTAKGALFLVEYGQADCKELSAIIGSTVSGTFFPAFVPEEEPQYPIPFAFLVVDSWAEKGNEK